MANLSVKIEFFKFYNIIKRQILDSFEKQLTVKDKPILNYLETVLDYNVPHGKLNRGVMLVQAYDYLNALRSFDIAIPCKMGWAIELLHSSFLVMDDIIDVSLTRRGQSCWYKVPHVGMKAVNDGLMLENCADLIVHQELSNKPFFGKVLDALREAKLATILGQHLDSQKFDLEFCTPSLYADIARLKTSNYTFLLPVLLAVRMSPDGELIDELELKNLCFKLGHYFQAQDDYLDCFGDPSITGKIGTDIQDGKCSWLLVEANQIIKANSAEFRELKSNYGQPTDAHVQSIKILYRKLNLLERYANFESECTKDIEKCISSLTVNSLRPFFQAILNDLRGRKR